MRLVENHRIRTRQQIGDAFLTQHQVGHEQGVVDHHDVGLLGLPAGLEHEAIAHPGAILPEAVFAGGCHALPDIGLLGDGGQIGLVACGRIARERLQLAQLLDLGACLQGAIVPLEPVKMIVAHIVGAPLEQRDAGRHPEGLTHARQVAPEELILERARAG